MPSRLRRFLIVGLTATACASPPVGESVDTAQRESAAIAPTRPPLGTDESDCPMDTTFRHTDPLALVEGFVRRDAEGPFEREDIARAWHDGALSCVERNTSDAYEIITAFRVGPLSQRPDTTLVQVTRERVFALGWDATGERPHLVPARAEWIDTVVVVHTRYGWRIDRLRAGAHRLPSRALDELTNLTPADRAQLERLASRARD